MFTEVESPSPTGLTVDEPQSTQHLLSNSPHVLTVDVLGSAVFLSAGLVMV